MWLRQFRCRVSGQRVIVTRWGLMENHMIYFFPCRHERTLAASVGVRVGKGEREPADDLAAASLSLAEQPPSLASASNASISSRAALALTFFFSTLISSINAAVSSPTSSRSESSRNQSSNPPGHIQNNALACEDRRHLGDIVLVDHLGV